MQVDHGGLQTCVTKELLNGLEAYTRFQKMRRETMAKCVRRDLLTEVQFFGDLLDCVLRRFDAHGRSRGGRVLVPSALRLERREQEGGVAMRFPKSAQGGQG